MKVLVVDEVGYTCYVHTRLLEELGYQVICASSGFEALSILEMDSEIKIMFSELVMRELDGLELFLKVQKQERYNDDGQLDSPMFFLLTSLQQGNQSHSRQLERLELAKKLVTMPVAVLQRCRWSKTSETKWNLPAISARMAPEKDS